MGEGERKTERSPIDYLDSRRTGEMRKKACSKNSSTNR